MSTISKRKQKRFDIEAQDRNETKMFKFVSEISKSKQKRSDLDQMFLYQNKNVHI